MNTHFPEIVLDMYLRIKTLNILSIICNVKNVFTQMYSIYGKSNSLWSIIKQSKQKHTQKTV